MSYGYIGKTPNQVASNTGVISSQEAAELEENVQLGGALELIESQNISSQQYLEFTNLKTDIYDVHLLTLNSLKLVTDGTNLGLQMEVGGAYLTTNEYPYATERQNSTGSALLGTKSNGAAFALLKTDVGMGTLETVHSIVYLYNLKAGKYPHGVFESVSQETGGNGGLEYGGFTQDSSNAVVTKIRLLAASGNLTSGKVTLYGLRHQ
jgi:hypothetical protein